MAEIDKIMSIYYGSDRLPYKDIERTIHYPIASGVNTFVGENNVSKVRFYVDLIGGANYTWLATIKKPDGTMGYKLLNGGNSGYVELDLSLFVTNQVGAVYISLTGYSASDVNIEEEDGIYSISGNPQMLVSGSVKIMVGYSPVVLRLGEDINPTIAQQILAYLNNVVTTEKSVVVFNYQPQPSQLADYNVGQAILVLNGENKLYKVVLNSANVKVLDEKFDFDKFPDFTKQEIVELVDGKVNKLNSTNRVYGTNGSGTDIGIDYSNGAIANSIPLRDGNGNFKVGNALNDNDAVNKSTAKTMIDELASFKITKNAQGQNFATYSELENATTFYSGGEIRTPTRNDIAYVLADENHDNATTKYSWQGGTYPTGQWEFDVVVNESPLTDAQINALNSSITLSKVNKYEQYENNKQNKVNYNSYPDNPQDGDMVVFDTPNINKPLVEGSGITIQEIDGVYYIKTKLYRHRVLIKDPTTNEELQAVVVSPKSNSVTLTDIINGHFLDNSFCILNDFDSTGYVHCIVLDYYEGQFNLSGCELEYFEFSDISRCNVTDDIEEL